MLHHKCVACEKRGYTWQSGVVLCVLLLVLTGSALALSKWWGGLNIKHLMRVSFDPARILFTYAQVTIWAHKTKLVPGKKNRAI